MEDSLVDRLLLEIKQRKMAQAGLRFFVAPDSVFQPYIGDMRKLFLEFIAHLQKELGLRDKDGDVQVQPRIAGELVADAVDARDALRKIWSRKGQTWSLVETQEAYVLTLKTLLSHFRVPKKPSSVFVSLGTGPGLYESFLAHFFASITPFASSRFLCVDYAKGMVETHRKMLKRLYVRTGGTRRNLTNIQAVLGDMANLSGTVATGSVDQVLCINSIQWVPEWRDVIKEIKRILDPAGNRLVHFVAHPHPMVLTVEDSAEVYAVSDCGIDELIAELESQGFLAPPEVLLMGSQGGGQMGSDLARFFFTAELRV